MKFQKVMNQMTGRDKLLDKIEQLEQQLQQLQQLQSEHQTIKNGSER
ncbi:hypothetical protein [Paenibacillus shenyangensis]|nr:hypothetical protein [Paenibacillus sp. A9]